MNDDQCRVLVNYIRNIADRMGLKDWQFHLDRNPASAGKIAQTEIWGDSQTATVWLGKQFFDYPPGMQRETIVHELCHWHTDKLIKVALVPMKQMGREAYTIGKDTMEVAHELALDGIAAAWARFFPVIDWTSQEPLYTTETLTFDSPPPEW